MKSSSRFNANHGLLEAQPGRLLLLTLAVSLSSTDMAPLLAQPLPTVSSGSLLVHLKADAGITTDVNGSNVLSWADQSTNAYTFNADLGSSRGYPQLITNGLGRPLIRFGIGTNTILGDTAGLTPSIELFPTRSSGLTIFAAFTSATNSVQQYLINHAVVAPAPSGYTVDLELGVDAGARGAGNFGLHRGGSDTTFTPNNTISNNVLYVVSTVIKTNGYAPSNLEIYSNGVAQVLGTFYSSGTPTYPGWLRAGEYATGAQGLFIGGRVSPFTSVADAYHRGDIAEIIIFQGALSLRDRAAVEAYLGGKYTVAISSPPPLIITSQPQTLAVTNGDSATFSVMADSVAGDTIRYQWRKSGTNLVNATNASLTLSPVGASDAAAYQCVVSIPSTNLTSASAQLRIYASAPLPSVSSGTLLIHLRADAGVAASGSDLTEWDDQSSNAFQFNVTANPFIWLFSPTPAIGLTGNKVIHFEGTHQTQCSVPIQLFTETNSPLTVFAAFSVRDNSVQRYLFNSQFPRSQRIFQETEIGTAAGNRNAPGSLGIHRAGGGATVTAANVMSNNQFALATVVIKSSGAAPNNVEVYENGNFLPVVGFAASSPTAPYTEVGWLSAGHYPTGAYPFYVGVAADSGNPSGFTPFGPLIGDIGELIIYQGQLTTADRGLVENYLSQKYGVPVVPPPTVTLTTQPQTLGITNGSGQSATFTVAAVSGTGATNFTYQWQLNGVNIVGATNASYTIPSAGLANVGSYRCVVTLSGTAVTSDAAQLRLLPDAPLPAVSTGNLLVHLRADAGVVSTNGTNEVAVWFDQSTNVFEFDSLADLATTFNPTTVMGTTGNRVLHFAGANSLLCSVPFQLFAETNSPVTIFTAFSTEDNTVQRYLVNLRVPRIGPPGTDIATRSNNVAITYGNSLGYTPNLTDWFNELSLGVDAGNRSAGNYGVHRAAGDSTYAAGNTISNNLFYTMSMVVKSTGGAPTNIAIYRNGTSLPVIGDLADTGQPNRGPRSQGWVGAGQYPTGSSNDLGGTNTGGPYELRIGATRDSTSTTAPGVIGNGWLGNIGEIIIYTGELSDPDRSTVESYLGQKYGIARPVLNVAPSGTNVVVSYPVSAGTVAVGTYRLESATNLGPSVVWSPLTPGISGINYSLTNAVTGQRYYRLRLQ